MRKNLWFALASLLAVPLLLAASAPLAFLQRAVTSYTTTANMGLSLPAPGTDTGPGWASALNAALTLVDQHNHTAGKGVQVPTAGLLINATLPMNSNEVTGLLGEQFVSSGLQVVGNAVLQASAGNMYWTDGSGNQIQMTCNGALCLSSVGGFGGSYVTDPSSPVAVYTTSTGNYTFTVDGGWEGGIAAGRFYAGLITKTASYTILDTDLADTVCASYASTAITITLPNVATNTGRMLTIKDCNGSGGTHTITIARANSALIDGALSKTITTNYGVVRLTTDGTNWFTL